jgi:hypothetical protein
MKHILVLTGATARLRIAAVSKSGTANDPIEAAIAVSLFEEPLSL